MLPFALSLGFLPATDVIIAQGNLFVNTFFEIFSKKFYFFQNSDFMAFLP